MQTLRPLLLSATAVGALTVAAPFAALADAPTRVVATFSILGDMVSRIGGDHVELTTLVGPGGDAHVYQLTPQAAAVVSQADLLIMNGLDFEGWLERLTEAAAFDGTLVIATAGIDAIPLEDARAAHDTHEDHAEHDHGAGHDAAEAAHGDAHDHAGHDHAAAAHDDGHDHAGHDHAAAAEADGEDHAGHDHGEFDPHAWLSLANAVVYVDNIASALAQADPDNAATFYQNRAAYVAEIEALETEIGAMMAALPEDRRAVVTSHDAFGYFGRDYGLTFISPQGLSTEAEASARDVARLIEQMRAQNISAVFLEDITDSRLLEQIAAETGATVSGTLYPGGLSDPDGPAATYLDMMRHNAVTLSQALGS